MKRHRGGMLGAVLMVIAICILVAFTVATTSTFHIRMSSSTANRQTARNLADTAVARGIEAAMQSANAGTLPKFGQNGETYQMSPPTLAYGCSSMLTFAKNTGGYPVSLYNSSNLPVLDGQGNVVPANTLDFVGVGQAGGITVTVETLVYMPPFEYVEASAGSFSSPQGGVTIARVNDPSLLANGYSGLAPGNIQPGSMASNNGGSSAIDLGPSSLVTGNISAVGNIQLASTAVVQGSQLPYSGAVVLPTIDLTQDPTASFSHTQVLSTLVGGSTIAGFDRSTSSISVPGDLTLNGAVYYVKGDLNVAGTLSGTGAIYTTGAVTVGGGVNLQSDDQMVVAAGGNVTLTGGGSSSNTNIFQGVVYSGGNLTASNVQLYGTFIASGQGSQPGNVVLGNAGSTVMNNVTLVSAPGLTQLALGTATQGGMATSSSCGGIVGSTINGALQQATTSSVSLTYTAVGVPGLPVSGFPIIPGSNPPTSGFLSGISANTTTTTTPVTGDGEVRSGTTGGGVSTSSSLFQTSTTYQQTNLTPAYTSLTASVSGGVWNVFVGDSMDTSGTQKTVNSNNAQITTTLPPSYTQANPHTQAEIAAAEAIAAYMAGVTPGYVASDPANIEAILAQLDASVSTPPPGPPPNPNPPLQKLNYATQASMALFNFDLDKFIAPADQMRVLMWRSLPWH